MSEVMQPNPDIRPGEQKLVQDPVQAELMAYAEKPHREYAITLREIANGEIADQLETHYQKNPGHRKISWEQKGDPKYYERDDLLADRKNLLTAAKHAEVTAAMESFRVDRKYRQDKIAESSK